MYQSSRYSKKKTCFSKSEAWRWIERNQRDFDSSSSKEYSTSSDEGSDSEEDRLLAPKKTKGEPERPPIGLSSRDVSTKDKTKLHDISIRDNSAKDLLAKLSPPGLRSRSHEDYCATLVDATSLPGKAATDEKEDAITELAHNIGEVAHELRQSRRSEETRKDSSWKKESTISLKGIKDAEELKGLINDIKETSPETMEAMKITQRAILSRYHWSAATVDAWVDCGFVTRTAEASLKWYIELLQHLQHTANTQSWTEAKKEMDFRVKEDRKSVV